ncbi:MAG: AAA family ATPase [Chloroflexales bacterium]
MTHEDRSHIERLLDIHRASLRELEVQAATFGDLYVPPHVAHQLTEHQGKIAELEAQLNTMMPLHNLPPHDYERFVGRQKELAEVRRLLLPYPKSRYHLITVDGIGGIGKSALALESAYSYCDGYATLPEAERFGAIVWISAKRSYLTADGILERRQAFRTLDDLYAAIAQVLDFPAITRARAEEQRAIVEQVLGEQRTLLILDNLETVDDEDLMVFLHELPDPTKAVVTTRHRIDVAHPVRLTGMPHEDALVLIDQEAVRKDVVLTADDREQLWLRTGGVPLAIVWSIGLMGLGGSAESVLRRLGSGQSDIAQFCFAESVAQIRGRDAYWLLLALSLFATDASREALGVVAGLGEDTFGRDGGLEDLLRLSLVNKSGDRFSLLPLTRSFAQEEAEQHRGRMRITHQRLEGYFFEFAKEFGGWSKDWGGQDRVERELPNILLIIDRMAAQVRYTSGPDAIDTVTSVSEPIAKTLIKFLTYIAQTCRLRGYWTEHERLNTIRLKVSRALNSQEDIGWSYYEFSKLSYVRNDLEALRYWATEARNVGHQQEVEVMYLLASRHLGEAALFSGNTAEATTILSETLAACKKSRRTWLPLHVYGSMGRLFEQQGDLAQAVDWYQQGIEGFEGSPANQAFHLLLLGRLKFREQALDQAHTYFQDGLSKAEECGRADVIAQVLLALAQLDHIEQRQQLASANADRALNLFRRLGMRKEQAEAEELLRRLGESA